MENKYEYLSKYDVVIGLEIHAELNTASKCFCGCANVYGSSPNTNCCPVCLALPGALPVLNRAAVEKTIAAGLAIGCEINDLAIFERKHYFYPDLPKAYQISQLVRPICLGGGIKLRDGHFVRLNRIHLEEDAGKLTHNAVSHTSFVDLNRCGVPLIEIVTEPDINSAAEAVEFLEEVRSRLVFAGIAECKMEQGGMRCDVNLSLKPRGSKVLGKRTEIKNLNSFKMVARAIEHEAERQAKILDSGKTIITETRKWDDGKGKTASMRTKEESQDYRYFPDPDIYPVRITRDDVARIKGTMRPLAHELREQFVHHFHIPEYDATVITKTREMSDFYLACVELLKEPKVISNWLMVDLLKIMNDNNTDVIPVTPKNFVEIIKMTLDKTITKTVGLQLLLASTMDPNVSPSAVAQKMGLLVVVSEQQILGILTHIKQDKPNLVDDYKRDAKRVLPFIIGQVMKATQGRAKSDLVEQLIPKVFK